MKLIINGNQIEAQEGDSVLEAARTHPQADNLLPAWLRSWPRALPTGCPCRLDQTRYCGACPASSGHRDWRSAHHWIVAEERTAVGDSFVGPD